MSMISCSLPLHTKLKQMGIYPLRKEFRTKSLHLRVDLFVKSGKMTLLKLHPLNVYPYT